MKYLKTYEASQNKREKLLSILNELEDSNKNKFIMIYKHVAKDIPNPTIEEIVKKLPNKNVDIAIFQAIEK